MPELPEVEAARKLARRSCHGKQIRAVIAADDNSASRLLPLPPSTWMKYAA